MELGVHRGSLYGKLVTAILLTAGTTIALERSNIFPSIARANKQFSQATADNSYVRLACRPSVLLPRVRVTERSGAYVTPTGGPSGDAASNAAEP